MNKKRCWLALDRMTIRMMDANSTATTTRTSVLAINNATTATSTTTISTTTISGNNSKEGAHNSDSHLGKEVT